MNRNRLKQLRERMGYSQADLAQRMNVTPQQISRWEVGKNTPHTETVAKLAHIFNVSTDYLMDESDFMLPDRDLNSDEMLLIEAYRGGRIWEILRLITQIDPKVTKDLYPSDFPGADAKNKHDAPR